MWILMPCIISFSTIPIKGSEAEWHIFISAILYEILFGVVRHPELFRSVVNPQYLVKTYRTSFPAVLDNHEMKMRLLAPDHLN